MEFGFFRVHKTFTQNRRELKKEAENFSTSFFKAVAEI
jgi:hypothetical protein